MQPRTTALRRLLAVELPLDRLGPRLRDDVRRALRDSDDDRLLRIARAVVGELLRRGDLLRVAVEAQAGDSQGPYCLLRGTTRLVDLAALGEQATTPAPSRSARSAIAPGVARSREHFADVDDMLGAMERAQDLDIGDPNSGDKGVILAGIVRLLAAYMPQHSLHIQLPAGEAAPEDQGAVFASDAAAAATAWQDMRPVGHSVWIPGPAELPAAVLTEHARSADREIRCAAAVPLWEPAGAEPARPGEAGLLYVLAYEDRSRESMLRLAERLSRFVTRRWQSQRDVNQRIHRDSLTGAHNRAYFDSQFPLELERARRSREPLTLVLADLDHFKNINDTLGHAAGDRVLQMVARRLHEELRRIDHICRIGGEEFAFILPDTSLEAVREVIGRLLEAAFVETVSERGESRQLRVTFSYGAVTFPAAGADPFELYRKADAMLYLSKDLGRNQCHIWSSQGDHIRLLPAAGHEQS